MLVVIHCDSTHQLQGENKMQSTRLIKVVTCALALLTLAACQNESDQAQPSAGISPEEARAIAKEAYIYANPVVDAYRAMYGWIVDEQDPEFKAPLNQIGNVLLSCRAASSSTRS